MTAASLSPLRLAALQLSGASAEAFTLRIKIPADFGHCVTATSLEVYGVNSTSTENEPLLSFAIDRRFCPGDSLMVSNIDLPEAGAATLNFVRESVTPPVSFQSSVYIER